MNTDPAETAAMHTALGDQGARTVLQTTRDYVNEHEAHGGCHPVHVDVLDHGDGHVTVTVHHQPGCPAADDQESS